MSDGQHQTNLGHQVATGGGPAITGEQHVGRNIGAEVVGTATIVLFGPGLAILGTGRVDDLAIAFGVGIGVAVAIGVIGAVANPAFTLALLLVREIGVRDAVADWTGQVTGGLLGAALVWGINDLDRVAEGSNGWDRDGYAGLGSVIAAEMVFGIVIVVVFLTAVAARRSAAMVAAFTGGAVAASSLVLIPIDGGGLNPARSVGTAVFADADPNALAQLWPFVVVPLIASVAAVFVWLAIDDAEVDDTIFDETLIDDVQDALTGDAD